jgi:ABC-type transport system substrate-binding protein
LPHNVDKKEKEMKLKTLYVMLIGVMALLLIIPSLVLGAGKPSGKVVFAQRGQNFASAIGGDHSTIKWLQPWVHALHEPMLIKDLQAKITPGLAESWEVSDGGLTIKMKLRKGPKFHNGDPITAQDVKFSLERYKNEKYRMVFYKELEMKLKNIEIIDDQTIIFRFNEAYNQFWDRFFEYYTILPKNYIEKVGDKEFAKNIVSSGPFKWVGYKQDVYFDMEAYEDHYRKVPEIKNLRIIYVVEDSTRLAMLKVGEADMIVPSPAHLNLLRKDPKFRLVQAENTRTIGLAFGDIIRPGNWPLKDRRVRMAVSYAIDRKAVCDIALQGAASPSNSFLAPWHAGWDKKRATPTPYDPEKAKALLKEAGYPNGFSTQINIQPTMKVDMQAVSGYLAKVGIKAKLNILESGAWTELCFSKKSEGIFWRDAWWNARSHPTSPIDVQLTLKAPWSCGITTKRVSDAIEAVGQIPIGHPDLAKKAAEMDDIITEDLPRISLYAARNIVALGPRIEYYEIIDGFLIPTRVEFIRLKK